MTMNVCVEKVICCFKSNEVRISSKIVATAVHLSN